MIKIVGKYNTAQVMTDVIEEEAYKQIRVLCDQEAYKESKIVIMPDVHAGAGCTIGTTMTIHGKICPNLVGVDIGCGVTSINLGKLEGIDIEDMFKALDKGIRTKVPYGFNTHEYQTNDPSVLSLIEGIKSNSPLLVSTINWDRALKSVGTLGGGNHFIELGTDPSNNYWLTVHSGSRNLGKQIAELFQLIAIGECKAPVPNSLKYLEESSDMYLKTMYRVQEYAVQNRLRILYTITNYLSEHFNTDISWLKHINTTHNYIDYSTTTGHILRKGAVSAKPMESLLIPMNMRDGIIVARGKGNDGWNCSAPHGAGRLYSRAQAKKQINLFEFKRAMVDVYSTCVHSDTLDEAPQAYKAMEDITKHINDTVQILFVIKPVYNFKG